LHSPFFVIYNHSIQIITREGWLPHSLKNITFRVKKAAKAFFPSYTFLTKPILFLYCHFSLKVRRSFFQLPELLRFLLVVGRVAGSVLKISCFVAERANQQSVLMGGIVTKQYLED